MVYDLLISCIQAAFIYSYQELVALSSPDLAQMAFQLSKRPLASRARGESAVSLGWTMNKICTNWRYRALWWRYFATNHLLELSPSPWSCFFPKWLARGIITHLFPLGNPVPCGRTCGDDFFGPGESVLPGQAEATPYFEPDIDTGWWFQTFFIFHYIWDNPSHWLICFKMVKTTNQNSI